MVILLSLVAWFLLSAAAALVIAPTLKEGGRMIEQTTKLTCDPCAKQVMRYNRLACDGSKSPASVTVPGELKDWKDYLAAAGWTITRTYVLCPGHTYESRSTYPGRSID